MASDRNWGRIQNGATFEELAKTLVFFEDAGAALFGRRGKDGGQDVRSGDGRTVYQAKHHEDGSAAKAIADAKKEAAKIAEYRQPGHARYVQWQGVQCWILVTNAAFNPTDEQRWKDDVQPLFEALELTANYWERATLDALLTSHPEVDRSFFENDTRVLLSLPEVRDRLALDAPFRARGEEVGFRGRAQEVSRVQEFLESDKAFLVISGSGGIGKTRLLVEAGAEIAADGAWQVLWAQVASMEAGGHWYDALVPERPMLLLVDEPADDNLLRQLSEQVGGRIGRASRWKVAVAVRSPKDPVLRFLGSPKMQHRVAHLTLAPLPIDAAEAVCAELIATGRLGSRPVEWQAEAARELSRRYDRHPVWMTLAVHVLEERGKLGTVPETAQQLADEYVLEVVTAQREFPQEEMKAVLRWVALLGPVNRENADALEVLVHATGAASKTRLLSVIANLVMRRAFVQRGARNRLVEVKPDVLRDYVLRQWLVTDVGFGEQPLRASDEASVLLMGVLDSVVDGSLGILGQAALQSIARTEWLLQMEDQSVPLLDPFFQGLHKVLTRLTASTRVLVANLVSDIAEVRPNDIVDLSRSFRTMPCETQVAEGFFAPREVGFDDVVLALAWPVFHAAMGAKDANQRRAVLRELIALVEAEEDIAGRRPQLMRNDGKRAADLVERAIGGGPQFWGDYEDAAQELGVCLLDVAAVTPLAPSRKKALSTLLEHATSIERHQFWSTGHGFTVRTVLVLPGYRSWETRLSLLSRVRSLLENEQVAVDIRVVLWDVLSKAHSSANRAAMRIAHKEAHGVGAARSSLNAELLGTLRWAHSMLANRKSSFEELKVARKLWDWHCEFDKDAERKQAADMLDALYQADELAAEFDPLVDYDERKEREKLARAKAEDLAASGSSEEITHFVARALRFLGSANRVSEVLHVAWQLGALAPTASSVQAFVRKTLGEPELAPSVQFAIAVASNWAAALRSGSNPLGSFALVKELVDLTSTSSVKAQLLRQLYGDSSPLWSSGVPLAHEHAFLRAMAPVFLSAGQGPAFLGAVGWTFDCDWAGLQVVSEWVLEQLPEEQLALGVSMLTDAIFSGFRRHSDNERVAPDDIGKWLLDQSLRVSDFKELGDHFRWHIERVFRRVQRPSVRWFVSAFQRLVSKSTAVEGHRVRSLSAIRHISQYVSPLQNEDATSADVRSSVGALIDLLTDNETVGFLLEQCVHDVDPDGVVVPSETVRRIYELGSADEVRVRRLARIGGAYLLNSAPWRTIAKSVVQVAQQMEERRRGPLFHELTDPQVRSYSCQPGEVPEDFIEEVSSARQLLDQETDADFRLFWQWNLNAAEAGLRYEVEQVKEERGD